MPADMRPRRARILLRTRREFATLDRLVARLRPVDWRRRVPRPEGRDPWTVKDALAHIVYWKEHTTRVIRGERRPPEMRGLDIEQINRLIYRRWRRRPPAALLRWHRRAHADALEALRETPDACFRRRHGSPEWPADFDGHSSSSQPREPGRSRCSPTFPPTVAWASAWSIRSTTASRPWTRSPPPRDAPSRYSAPSACSSRPIAASRPSPTIPSLGRRSPSRNSAPSSPRPPRLRRG
jgi:hypothetical protein